MDLSSCKTSPCAPFEGELSCRYPFSYSNVLRFSRLTYASFLVLLILIFLLNSSVLAQDHTQKIVIGEGWAKSSVNAVIFRQASVVTYQDWQFTAYYNPQGEMVLAKRKHGSTEWEKRITRYEGNVKDAHNAISIAVDGSGILHVAWDHHGHKLNYVQGRKPGSLELTDRMPMTGHLEEAVTYPQFYKLDNGDLLSVYRDGSSGNGSVLLNYFDAKTRTWKQIAHPLIDGEGERNAYVNTLAMGDDGSWHLSWTWRESWDVATNHDIMYAHSPDRGKTWYKSNGERYQLPITEENAEVVYKIPQGSELINQTSMTLNSEGEPVIASYWREQEEETTPQYRIVWQDEGTWKQRQVSNRTRSFSLSGGGTRRIPISRPHILAGDQNELYLVYRDFEQGGGITVAISGEEPYRNWSFQTIYEPSLGLWEPSYDRMYWQRERQLHLFGQKVGQGDGETLEEMAPQEVFILEWTAPMYRD